MQITQDNVEKVLMSTDAPLSVDDIAKSLNLDDEHEATLKTSSEKRIKSVLYRLEKQGTVKIHKFANKKLNYYKYRPRMLKNLFIEILTSDLRPIYVREFKEFIGRIISPDHMKILDEEVKTRRRNKELKKKTSYFS